MKQILRNIEFSADFPDDTVWDESEQIIQTAGQAMAHVVAEMLKAMGAEVSAPEDHLEHGWGLDALWQDGKFWLQVTQIDEEECHILTQDNSLGFFARLMGKKSPYTAFLEGLHKSLSSNGRFRDIRWQPWIRNPDVPGALGPTSPYPGPAVA